MTRREGKEVRDKMLEGKDKELEKYLQEKVEK